MTTCRGLANFPQRGTPHDDIRPGLRIISHARRVTVAVHVAGETVAVDRILYTGRALGPAAGSA